MDYELKKDFVPYTKKLLEQYNHYIVNNSEICDTDKHEITLLVNCLFGLLMVPNKLYYESLNTSKTLDDLNNEFKQAITFETLENRTNRILSFKDVILSLRNGLGHWFENRNNDNNVQFEAADNEINSLIIEGTSSRYKVKIRAKFDVHHPEELYKFLNKICGEN